MITIKHNDQTRTFLTPKAARLFLERAVDGDEFEVNGMNWLYLYSEVDDTEGEFKVAPHAEKGDFDMDCYFLTLDEVEEWFDA